VPPDIPADLAAALAERYELRQVLGRGGMATVYLAYDRKHRRDVALKVLLPGLAAFLGVERFLKEIQVAARLTHPHILALHDSGEAGGFLYYVMPYIEGGSLRQHLAGKRPPGDDQALAAGMVRMLGEPALRSELIRKGKQRVERYRPGLIARRLLDLLRAG